MSPRKLLAPSPCSFRIERQHPGSKLFGLDEVGRGSIAGPVVVAAVCFDPKWWTSRAKPISLIRDSKLLSAELREELYSFILKEASAVDWVEVCNQEVDRLNVLRATLQAFKTLVFKLMKDWKIDLLLVDGNQRVPDIPIQQRLIVQGDQFSKSIAAASIVAKVIRDRRMCELSKNYPNYGFDRHKGYGTSSHWKAINEFGPCPLHRRSFLGKPLKNKIGRDAEFRVVRYLQDEGFQIIHRNWRCKIGEIDIVAKRANSIHFIEVRKRPDQNLELAFPPSKQQQVKRVIEVFLQRKEAQEAEAWHTHFISVTGKEIFPEWDVFRL